MRIKLNVLLAKTEQLAPSFKRMISDRLDWFKNHQGSFKGIKKTYSPKPDTIDLPNERQTTRVVSTVKENLDWIEETAQEYIDNLFAVEATNASGTAVAELKVDGVSFGTLSSLELLRLRSLLDSEGFEDMYKTIPVRSDSENWDETLDPEYQGRDIFENKMLQGTKKSITKENYILTDPNVPYLKDTSKYQPVVATKDTIIEIGDYTIQHFTGEATHRERAEILRRRSKLIVAITEALKVANEVEATQSNLKAKSIFSYLHTGTIVE